MNTENGNAPRARPAAPPIAPRAPRAARPQSPIAAAAPGRQAPAVRPAAQTLRRTVIPILLTMAVLALSLAIAWTMLDSDSAFRELGAATPVILLAIGAVCGVLAGLNIATMRRIATRDPR